MAAVKAASAVVKVTRALILDGAAPSSKERVQAAVRIARQSPNNIITKTSIAIIRVQTARVGSSRRLNLHQPLQSTASRPSLLLFYANYLSPG